MAKPSIFAFTTAYHPMIGGAEIAIQEVARRLVGEFRFFIITARMRRDLPPREVRPEGTVMRVGFGFSFDKWLLPFLGPLAFFRERPRAGTPLVWGMDVSNGSLAAACTRLLSPRARFVLTIQYGYGSARLRHGRFGMTGRSFRFMLRRADAVTAISNYLAGEAVHFGYRRPVALLHNGVALETFLRARSSPRGEPPPTIITTSRLVPKNGVDVLIRALGEVRRSFPEVRCHVLGSGPEGRHLEELARTLGVAPAVTFFGDVPYGDVPRYLAAADVFVRPARSEGMGSAFVEALAAGVPIVGTPVEGVLDIIEDGKTGLFARVDDPIDVAEKIVRLLHDRALRRRIVTAGTAMVRERFSWDAIASGYAEVFRTASLPRILIATPMLPPAVGGPGAYAQRLAAEFSKRGHRVSVLSYGARAREPLGRGIRQAPLEAPSVDGRAVAPAENSIRVPLTGQARVSLSLPLPVRLLRYACTAWRMLGDADIALALDPVAVGLPLALAGQLRRKPFILRLEGDSLWERYVERTGEELTLRQFSEALPRLSLSRRELAWQRAGRWVFPRARRIVFSSHWREDVFRTGYQLRPEQSGLIAPPWPQPGRGEAKRDRTLVYAGRFVRAKNIPRLIRAFLALPNFVGQNLGGRAVARADLRLELIGDGPERPEIEALVSSAGGRIRIVPSLPHDALVKRIAQAHAFVLPSLSDVSPNVILDCIAAGTPFLLTRETGFYETLKSVGLFADPLDGEDIAAKLRTLSDPQSYAARCRRLAEFNSRRSWENVTGEWLTLLAEAIASGT